jgi:subtilisin family serine protease
MNATKNLMSVRSGLFAMLCGLGVFACGVAPSEEAAAEGSALTPANAKFIDKTDAVADEFIVVFVSPAFAPTQTANLASKYNARVFHTYESVLSGFAARMSEADARSLAQDPSVKYVERNGIKHTSEVQANATWGLDRTDQVSLPLNRQYSYGLTGRGVNAVVIDTGVDARHPDFGGRVGRGFNALSTGAEDDASDVHGHGTHVAGTIGSKTWGLAKDVTIIPVRVCNAQGQCTDADIVKAVDWVTRNVAKPAVVNMSLGGTVDAATQATEDAIRASIASGITYVVAAGNDSKDACLYSPARMPEVITTGATSQNDRRSFFSNFGTCLDVFAPGSGIISARRNSTGSTSMDGTSMASPHTAGVAALLLESVPTATPAQMEGLIRRNATPDKVVGPGAGSRNLLLHIGAAPILTLE